MTTQWGLATVERRSATEQVLQELRAAIIDGRIGPRAPLREVALADAFGTGRSAIREALSALAQEGLVVSERNRGTRVRELSPADVIDVYRARDAIETGAVAAALERGPVDLGPLRRALDELRTVSDRDGFESPSQALIAADIDFHRTLVALAQSPGSAARTNRSRPSRRCCSTGIRSTRALTTSTITSGCSMRSRARATPP